MLIALAPVFLAIFTGWLARSTKIVPEDAWGGITRLVYTVVGPTYLFLQVARVDLSFDDLAYVEASLIGFLVMGVIAFVLLPICTQQRSAFASAHQSVTRWNAFVLLAASEAMMGPEATALIALIMGPAIPIVNVMIVWVHARWGDGQNPSFAGITRSLATNPMIIACSLGLIVNFSGMAPTGFIGDFLDIIGRGALGIALMCVGAGLNLSAISARPGLMAASLALKLVAGPLVFIGLGMAFGLTGVHLACMAIVGASPSPPAAYVLTREMGGAPTFMAGHITASTILSALAIPAALAVAQMLGGSP
jgi:predicted permease